MKHCFIAFFCPDPKGKRNRGGETKPLTIRDQRRVQKKKGGAYTPPPDYYFFVVVVLSFSDCLFLGFLGRLAP